MLNALHVTTIIFSAACLVANTEALNCFVRNSITGSNGTATACSGYTYCYSYSDSYGNGYAGCSITPDVCNSVLSCVVCTTDYCNSMTPSSISCYTRYASSGSNGTITACSTGVNACFSYESNGYLYGGCGACTSSTGLSCVACNSSNCNTASLSSISCYARSGTSMSLYTSPGSAVSCATGTCYSYLNGYSSYAGCGKCNVTGPNGESCVICNTNLCNTHVPSSISCYYSSVYVYAYSDPSSFSNGTIIPCSTGISNCYSKCFLSYYYSATMYGILCSSGCGVCSSSAVASVNASCTTCDSGSCNYFQMPSYITTSAVVQPTSSLSTQYTIHNTQSTNTRSTFAQSTNPPSTTENINKPKQVTQCFHAVGGETKKKVDCDSSSCFKYAFSYAPLDNFLVGCGGCEYISSFLQCRICSTDLCNSGQVSAPNGKLIAAFGIALLVLPVVLL